ncbi:DUF2147 domain-containing protein [Dysgonomonas sp. HDW5B]|uniref:DUF2147 domain-containing protein n=1 Tax=Dysgonomonas sp. HDW5B TaxID=2714927 RepID=UPI0014094360|nr:DUF2147 domain-containing protein [Dysgonomonas sp. HDW5B]QIK54828.1 DUF2147 domain-containing protein [Dysgonomonas sp. HDW5B]
MKKIKISILLVFLVSVFSVNAQSVIGKWKTFDDATGDAKSIVEITEKDGKIYGKVIEILNPEKKNAKCNNCPDSDKDKPVLGLYVIKGLSKDGKEYSNGKILDPSSGKLYKCTVSLDGNDKLKVRGYVGISAFGRNQIWTRVK